MQNYVAISREMKKWPKFTKNFLRSATPHFDDPSRRYLLPNIVDFVASVTNTKDPQKSYSKRYVCALHAATKTVNVQ